MGIYWRQVLVLCLWTEKYWWKIKLQIKKRNSGGFFQVKLWLTPVGKGFVVPNVGFWPPVGFWKLGLLNDGLLKLGLLKLGLLKLGLLKLGLVGISIGCVLFYTSSKSERKVPNCNSNPTLLNDGRLKDGLVVEAEEPLTASLTASVIIPLIISFITYFWINRLPVGRLSLVFKSKCSYHTSLMMLKIFLIFHRWEKHAHQFLLEFWLFFNFHSRLRLWQWAWVTENFP